MKTRERIELCMDALGAFCESSDTINAELYLRLYRIWKRRYWAFKVVCWKADKIAKQGN